MGRVAPPLSMEAGVTAPNKHTHVCSISLLLFSSATQPYRCDLPAAQYLNLSPGMRYDNWDVIVFPKESAIPIQEFRTACYMTQDESQLPLLSRERHSAFVGLTSHFVVRWPLPSNIDLLHRVFASSGPLPHLHTLVGFTSEALQPHRIPEERQPESRLHCPGHHRRGPTIVGLLDNLKKEPWLTLF